MIKTHIQWVEPLIWQAEFTANQKIINDFQKMDLIIVGGESGDAISKTDLKRTTHYKLRKLNKVKWSKIGRKIIYLNTSMDEQCDSNSNKYILLTKKNQK